MSSAPTPDAEAARRKAEKYCAFQERCSQQLRTYLSKMGLPHTLVEDVIRHLIKEGFINDERFARAYARGKFRNNGWGRIRIAMALRQLMNQSGHIDTALDEIDEEEYLSCLEELLRKKWHSLDSSGKTVQEKKHRLGKWAYGRGYEPDLVQRMIQQIMK